MAPTSDNSVMVVASMALKKIDLLFDAEERQINENLRQAYNQSIQTLIQKVKNIFTNIEGCQPELVDEQYIRDFLKE